MDQSAPFPDMFNSETIPELSVETLDCAESLLISGIDSQVKEKIPAIINFFCENLPNSPNYEKENAAEITEMQRRILLLLHLVKPIYLTQDLSSQIERKLFELLDYDGCFKIHTLSILIDHFITDCHGIQENGLVFLHWARDYLTNILDDIANANFNFTFILITNFKSIIQNDKNGLKEAPQFCELFLDIANKCLEFSSEDYFFPNIEQLCAKSLKITYRIYDLAPKLSPKALNMLIEMNSTIPRKVQFSHIFLNYLVLCATIFSAGDSNVNPKITEIVKTEILQNLSLFTQKPIVQSRKLIFLLNSLSKGLQETIKAKDSDIPESIISCAFKFLTCTDILQPGIAYAIQILKNIYSTDQYRTNVGKISDVIEQLMSVLEMHLDNFYDAPEQWGAINSRSVKVIGPLLKQLLNLKKDEKTSRMDIMSRLTVYQMHVIKIFSKILTTQEYKIYKNYFLDILGTYIEIASSIPSEWSYEFFSEHMQYFMPSEQSQTYSQNFVPKLISKIKAPGQFILAMFEYLTPRMSNTPKILIELLYRIVIDTYSNTPVTQLQQNEIVPLAHAFYNLFLASINANNTFAIDLVFCTTLRGIQRFQPGKEHRLSQFVTDLKQTGINWSYALMILKPELVYSRLAIQLYPILDIQKGHEYWYGLFLPALEANEEKMNDIYSFCTAVQHNFGQSFTELKNPTKIRTLNALTRQLSSSGSKVMCIRILLQQISDITSQQVSETNISKPIKQSIVYDEKKIILETVFNGFKESKNENVEFLLHLFDAAIEQISYNKIVMDKTIDEMVKTIKEKKIELFNNYFIQKLESNPEIKYSCYYFHFVVFEEIIIPDSEVRDFLSNSSFMFYQSERVKIILQIIDRTIELVPFSKQWYPFIIQILMSSQQEYKYGLEIIRKHILEKKYEKQEEFDVLNSLYSYCVYSSSTSLYTVKKVITPILYELDKVPSIKKQYTNRRNEMIEKYINNLSYPYIYINNRFVFTRSFTEFNNQKDLIEKVMRALKFDIPDSMCRSQKFQKNILLLISKGSPTDPLVAPLKRKRHLIKTLARGFIALPQESFDCIQFFKQLSSEKNNHQFLPYFLRCLEKGVENELGTYDSLPSDPTKIFSFAPPNQIPKKSDLRIIRFLSKTGKYASKAQLFLRYISACCTILRSQDPTKRRKVHSTSEYLIQTLNNCAKFKNDPATTSSVLTQNFMTSIKSLIDLTQALRLSPYPVHIPLDRAVPGLESEFLGVFKSLLNKETNMELITTLEKLFSTPSLIKFTSLCVEALQANLDPIVQFYQKINQSQPNVVITICEKTFSAFSKAANNHNLPGKIMCGMIKVTIHLINTFYKDLKRYRPTQFFNLINILIPRYLEEYANDDLLAATVIKESIPFVLGRPMIFMNQIGVKRVACVLKKLVSLREKTVPYFIKSMPESIQIKSFFKQVLYEFFSEFPPENPIDIPIGDGESNNIIEMFTFHYSSCRLLKINNVDVPDALNSYIYYINSDINELLILNKKLGIDSITTFSMLRKITLNGKVKELDSSIEDKFQHDMVEIPYYISSLNVLKCIGLSHQNFKIKDHLDIQLFTIGLGLKFICSNQNVARTLKMYPQLFNAIVEDFDKKYYQALFNLFLEICVFFVEEGNQDIPTLFPTQQVFNALSDNVNFEDVNENCLAKLKKQLKSFNPSELPNNIQIYRLGFVLIPSLVKFLFHKKHPNENDYFSDVLLPGHFLNNKHIFDFYNFFKPVLKAAYKYSSKKIVNAIVNDLEKFLRSQPNINISEKLDTPFATVLRWAQEINVEQHVFKQVEIFLDGLKAYNGVTLANDLQKITFPIKPCFYKQIEENIKALDMKEKLGNVQKYVFYGKKPRISFLEACWKNNWSVQPESHHIYIFAKFFYPEEIADFVNYLVPQELFDLLSASLSDNCNYLRRFMMYYTSLFGNSSLAKVFYATDIFAMYLPLPRNSEFRNIKYLAEISNHDDMLGIVKTKYPSLEVAASYHQLCQYESARQYYLNDLYDKTDNIGLVMHLIRPIVLNLDFVTMNLTEPIYANVPEQKSCSVSVPITKIFASKSNLTEKNAVTRDIFIPKTHFILPTLTSIQRLVVFDEALSTLRTLQKTPLDSKSIAKLKTHIADGVDRNCFLVSALGFRIQQIQSIKQFKDQFSAISSFNLSFVSLMLSKTNSIRQAIKIFQKCLQTIDVSILQIGQQVPRVPDAAHNFIGQKNNNIIAAQIAAAHSKLPPQMAISSTADNRWPLPVTHSSMPRIYKMLAHLTTQSAMLTPAIKTRLDYMLEVFDFSAFMKITAATKMQSIPFTKFFTFMYAYFPKFLCNSAVLSHIFTQLSLFISTNTEQFNVIFSLALAAVRKAPEMEQVFIEKIISKLKLDQQTSNIWIFWLPHLLSIFKTLPNEFMRKLIQLKAINVRAIMHNVIAAHSAKSEEYIQEDLANLCKEMSESWTKMREYDSLFSWTRDIEDDISEYKNKVFVHTKLAEELAMGKEISKEVKQIAGDDIDEIIKYTEENPPYFKTSKRTIDLQNASGFKFPQIGTSCFNLQVFADGTKEAMLQFTTLKGASTSYTIVCSELFPLNYSAEIFLHCLSGLFNSHSTAKLRSNFLDRSVTLYYLHSSLVLMLSDGRSLQQISGVPIVSKLLQRRKELMEQQGTLSKYELETPFEIKKRKSIQYETKSMIKWIIDGAGGNKIDFMFMRQSLVSHLAAISAIKFLFNSGYMIYPNIMFNKDRRKIYIPGLLRANRRIVHMPLTPLLSSFIPDYVFQGTFATIWHIVFDSVANNSERFMIFYNALIDPSETSTKEVIRRATMSATLETVDSDKEGFPMQIALVDHLIETSSTVFSSQEMAFAWI